MNIHEFEDFEDFVGFVVDMSDSPEVNKMDTYIDRTLIEFDEYLMYMIFEYSAKETWFGYKEYTQEDFDLFGIYVSDEVDFDDYDGVFKESGLYLPVDYYGDVENSGRYSNIIEKPGIYEIYGRKPVFVAENTRENKEEIAYEVISGYLGGYTVEDFLSDLRYYTSDIFNAGQGDQYGLACEAVNLEKFKKRFAEMNGYSIEFDSESGFYAVEK
ncbi:MAG: hypothetical protein GX126_05915 [Bacteroidales bacterium]|jgi:hypothetical protein|nr:hypothetical protein [Bacteroidales bacterium]